MTFRIADTFTDALTRLTNDEQKVVKTKVYDLQTDPSGNSLRLHKLTGGRDKHFWSVSASMDIRIIVHRQTDSLLLCYVDHHDKAYQWAENRKLEVHQKTGAAQLVELLQTRREVREPAGHQTKSAAREPSRGTAPPPLRDYSDDWLLQYGIPPEWLDRLRSASEDELLELATQLPGEAAEAVIDIAAGYTPPLPVQQDEATQDPFEHPDALRRFRTIESKDELAAALDAPWDKWTIFLHPSQRELVSKDFSGPARVSGSAGTGKTVVALHRAVHLVRANPESRVLLTTFSDSLANALRNSLRRLIRHEPQLGERIEVKALDTLANEQYRYRVGQPQLPTETEIGDYILAAAETVEHDFTTAFLLNEWHNVVDQWQLTTWEAYRDVRRLGRRTRLAESRRRQAWDIFAQVFEQLGEHGQVTQAGIYQALSEHYAESRQRSPYDHIVVDEAQDISVSQLRFLASLIGDRPNGLFFSGDLGQRIFQAPFSWSSLGVEVRGRASTLRINYRTSHQIRQQADRLLSPEVADVDGNVESRTNTQSVFNGPAPTVQAFADEEAEFTAVGEWIAARIADGVAPEAIAVFVRSRAEIDRGRFAIESVDQEVCQLDEQLNTKKGAVVLSTMHLAKGLEFRAVAVMACDEDVIPSPTRLENIRDLAEIEEVYDTERHLLYVACTRARDFLWISSAGEGSEFLDDILE